MGRYYGSEALRNPKLPQKMINYGMSKLNPLVNKVGSEALNQLSTKIRPKKKYKTNRKDLDGGAIDIQKQLAKLGELHLRTPTGKKYNLCGPGTKLEERLNSGDPKYRDPINKVEAICQQHHIHVAYSQAGNDLSKKHQADDVMVKAIGDIIFSQRPWFSTLVKYIMQTKRKIGLGVPKNVESRRVKKKNWQEKLANELHKPIKRNFTRRRVIANYIDEIWAADLVEMQQFSK